MMNDYSRDVRNAVNRQIRNLESIGETGPGKAELANLRKAAGKTPQQFPELWGAFLDDLPIPEYESKSITPQEQAVFIALTMYAMLQQGNSPVTHSMNEENISLGQAAGKLAGKEEETQNRIRAKLKSLVSAKNETELTEHLRRMIQLMKSKDIHLDFPQLAEDLYWYHFPKGKENVQLKWARDFVRTIRENTKIQKNADHSVEEK